MVASLLSEAPTAPVLHAQGVHTLTAADLQEWIRQAKRVDSSHLRAGVVEKGVVVLEQLLATLSFPRETRLLENYPNPFNPET